MLAAYGAVACFIACVIAAAAGFNKERLSGAILGGAAIGTAITFGMNCYLNWQFAQDPHGNLVLPLAVWLIVPACVVASVPYSLVKGRYLAGAGSRITPLTFVRWAVLGACSAAVPLVFAASYTWMQGRHVQYGDALTVLALIGAGAGVAACAVGAGATSLSRRPVARHLARGHRGHAHRHRRVLVPQLAVRPRPSLEFEPPLFKVWITAPAYVEKYGRSSAVGHLTFPVWVWLIAPACVVAVVAIVAIRRRAVATR